MLQTILFSILALFTTQLTAIPIVETDPIGSWAYVVPNVPDVGDVKGTMEVSKEGDAYKVVLKSNIGEATLSDVKLEGNKLSGELDAQGLIIVLKGSFDGDAFTGEFSSEYGAFPVSAERE